MTEEQKKKYEESARAYLKEKYPNGYATPWSFVQGYVVACEAHSEGKKEGWNEALDEIQTKLMTEYRRLNPELIYDELQKLRK